jgi:hypothetical protein
VRRHGWLLGIAVFTLGPSLGFLGAGEQSHIPRVWDDDALANMTLPIIGLGTPAHHVSAEYYDRICVPMHTESYAVIANCFCVRTVSHTCGNLGQTPSVTGTPRRVSMLGQIVDRKCVGGTWCGSARADSVNFQACSFNHSDISPFRINDLRAAGTG